MAKCKNRNVHFNRYKRQQVSKLQNRSQPRPGVPRDGRRSRLDARSAAAAAACSASASSRSNFSFFVEGDGETSRSAEASCWPSLTLMAFKAVTMTTDRRLSGRDREQDLLPLVRA